jgi:putative methyltransferase (TIGR04325 family)
MVLRRMIPRSIKNKIRQVVRPEFNGNYVSWSAANAAAVGFDVPQMVDKVRSSILQVKRGEAVFERDSVCFYEEHFQWPLLAALLYVAAKNGGKLHVADFGGSLGSSYIQHRKFLDGIKDLKWSIVEQLEYVNLGQREFEDNTVRFFHTLDQCAERDKIDVTLFSGSLQYLEEPVRFLERAAAISNYLIVDRVPFIDGDADRIAIQSPPTSIYKGSHPHRFFARIKFAQTMSNLGLVLLTDWPGFDHPANIKSEYEGRVYVAERASLQALSEAARTDLNSADVASHDMRKAQTNWR